MLEAKGITVRVGQKHILDGVDVLVNSGEVLAICGPNGAGKSTLLKVLAGQMQADEGEVVLNALALGDWNEQELSRARALLHQHAMLTFPFTVREVVEFGRYPHHNGRGDEQVVQECLSLVGMAELADRDYTTLSGGEKQRVQLARVLAQLTGDVPAQKVLMLDEPTSALDLPNQDSILEIATERSRVHQDAVVVVLHDLNLAAAWADRILFLDQGRRVASGTPEDVITTEVIRDLYGVETHIGNHPDTGRPVVLVRRTSNRSSIR